MQTRGFLRPLLAAVVAGFMLGLWLALVPAAPVGATHFRSAQMTWVKGANPNTAEFHITISARRSYFSPLPQTGATINFGGAVDFGDGTSDTIPDFTVVYVDAANDYFIADGDLSHTYPGAGPYTASYNSCCRLSSPAHVNNPDADIQFQTVVNFAAPGSPESSISPIVDCPQSATCTFSIPAAIGGGFALTYRLATSDEMCGTGSSCTQPTNGSASATVSPSGLYSWTTPANTSGQDRYYSTQVIIEARNGATLVSSIAVDFFIRLSDSANNPPAFDGNTPADGTVLNASVGSPVSFAVSASDPDSGDAVTLAILNLPAGATFNPTIGNPASGTFSWTPAAGGTVVMTLTAHDQHGLQATQRSVTINVSGGAGQVTLTLTPATNGSVGVTPPGTTTGATTRTYTSGTLVTLTAQPDQGRTFTGWTVDGAFRGWATPLTITMQASHTVAPTFVPTPAFGDFQPGDPAIQPVIELAARGYVKGCDQQVNPPSFCSEKRIKRAEAAALIVRALGWGGTPPANPFKDRCDPANPADCVDQELWDAVGILAVKGVTVGYSSDADCGGPGTAPCFAPRNEVTYGQVILFISRAMTAQGYWLGPLGDNRTLFPELPQASDQQRADRLSIVAYVTYAGAPPDVDTTPGQPFASFGTPSTRGWFARAFWQALNSYWGVDAPKNHGGYVP